MGNIRDIDDNQITHNIPGTPSNGTYWTAKGSKRKLPNKEALRNGVIYVVKKQPNPLGVWFAPEWQEALEDYEQSIKEAT